MQIRRNYKVNYWKFISLVLIGVLTGFLIGKSSISQPPNNHTVEIIVKKDSIIRNIQIAVDSTKKKTISKIYPKLNERTLMSELKKNNIKHPNIVLAQAKLETGNFTSKVSKTHNNLFGLRKGNKYRSFSHWTESVKAYKNLIQDNRYTGGNYYAYLRKIKYAEDKSYINKLKEIV